MARPEDVPDRLLSTGEAAVVLGSTRQHVVNLCERGDLAFSWAGSHRRIRRADLDRVRADTATMTRPERRSLWLAATLAGQVAVDPDATMAAARAEVERTERLARGHARTDLAEWRRLLVGPVHPFLAALTDPSVRGRQRRKSAPFAGVLDPAVREAAIAAWQAEERRLRRDGSTG